MVPTQEVEEGEEEDPDDVDEVPVEADALDPVVVLGRKLASERFRDEEREKAQASNQTLTSALSVGGSLLGALFGGGRRGSSISKASTAARSVSRAGKERADVAHAEADAQALREQIEALNAELEAEVSQLESESDPAAIPVESRPVTVGLQVFASTDQGIDWSIITAATLLTTAPLLVAFLLFQRQFVASFMRAGIR